MNTENEMSESKNIVVDDAMLERAWIAASSACVGIIDGEHRYVAPLSPSDWYAALKPAIEAALSYLPSSLNERFGNSEQLARADAAGGLNEQSGNSGQLHGDAVRAEFEAWASDQGFSICKDPHGLYLAEDAFGAWTAWQHLAARQPVGQEPVVVEVPSGAIINGAAFADRLERDYQFECPAGPLVNCTDYAEFRRCFDHLAQWASSLPPLYAAHPQPAAPAAVPVDVECGNCHDGKSDMDHDCRECGGTGQLPPAVQVGALRDLLVRRQAQWRSHIPANPDAPGTREIETTGETDYNNDVAIWRQGIAVMDEALALLSTHPQPAAAKDGA